MYRQSEKTGALQQISTGFASCLRYCSDVAQWKSTKLCTMIGCLLIWYTIYTFSEALAPDRILPGAKFSLRPSLAFSYIGSVTARHSGSGRQPVCGVVQGMELQNFLRECHVGRPSRWASAHILVTKDFLSEFNSFLIILLRRIAVRYVDAAYCYRPSSVVCLSVTVVSPAKTAEPIEMPFMLRTRVSPRNHVLDGAPASRMGRGNLGGRGIPL